jgi:AmiR/NasT family two-component response regulator
MPGTLRSYSVLLVSDSKKGTSFFEKILADIGFSSVTSVSSAGEARRQMISNRFDILIVNAPLPDEQGSELSFDASENTTSGIVLFVKSENFEQISYLAERHGVIAVSKPASAQDVTRAIRLAGATRERMRALEAKNIRLHEKMDEIRIVNRAKWALISNLGMDEPQAHRYVEKHAMDMRITKREAAETIIKTYEK